MAPMLLDLGGGEVAIVVVIALLLFGGRLAGIGKSAGRAIKEFKEETSGLSSAGSAPKVASVRPADTVTADPALPTQAQHAAPTDLS